MEKILSLKFDYDYNIKSKARPQANWRNRSIRNPSKDEEAKVNYDTKLQLTKDQLTKLQAITVRKDVTITVEVFNIYRNKTKKLWGTPKMTACDVDNFLKLWCDANNTFLYSDDRIIYKMSGIKLWGEEAHATVKVTYYEI